MKPCESCHKMYPDKDLKPCPVCGRGTCPSCQCPDEAGNFVLCEACAQLDRQMS